MCERSSASGGGFEWSSSASARVLECSSSVYRVSHFQTREYNRSHSTLEYKFHVTCTVYTLYTYTVGGVLLRIQVPSLARDLGWWVKDIFLIYMYMYTVLVYSVLQVERWRSVENTVPTHACV